MCLGGQKSKKLPKMADFCHFFLLTGGQSLRRGGGGKCPPCPPPHLGTATVGNADEVMALDR